MGRRARQYILFCLCALSVLATAEQVELTWSPDPGADGYEVWCETSDRPRQRYQILGGSSSAFVLDLTSGAYRFSVVSIKDGWYGPETTWQELIVMSKPTLTPIRFQVRQIVSDRVPECISPGCEISE